MSGSTPSVEDQIDIPTVEGIGQLYNPPIRGTSAQVTAIISKIIAMIRKGELAPGQRLIEADLTDTFGVVRGRVREALLILAGEGMVELVPQRGARVPKLEPGGLIHHLQVLEAIVAKGMELFGQRFGRPEGEVAEALRAAYGRIEEAAPMEVNRRTVEYYVLVNHLSGNPRLNPLIAGSGILLYERQLGEYLAAETHMYVVEPHRIIVREMLAGRSEEAAAALRANVNILVNHIREDQRKSRH
ncbi:DNA-binding transcriptional regulator, GntR family [Sphingobium faniae]|nr:DNA-binding transcriptional regulator, GntR family [Sphingobium faniae]